MIVQDGSSPNHGADPRAPSPRSSRPERIVRLILAATLLYSVGAFAGEPTDRAVRGSTHDAVTERFNGGHARAATGSYSGSAETLPKRESSVAIADIATDAATSPCRGEAVRPGVEGRQTGLPSPGARPAAPTRLPASGGEVILPNARAVAAHDTSRYATARRVGNVLYVSGVIISRGPNEGTDAASLCMQVRRGFGRLQETLAAAGATFADVAKINSFHVWSGPDFTGTPDQHFRVFSSVLAEYIAPPYPAWTAVGTTGTLGTGGVAEIELIAHLPDAAR